MKLGLNFLVVSVGHMCNLRCKNCGTFAPYSPPESKRYPIESLISDFEALFKAVGRINLLQIQGGKPLIYSDLPKLVGYLGACKEIGTMEIATNGTIMPSDKLMHVCSINNVHFRISNYLQNKENMKALLEKMQLYRVPVSIYEFISRESLWFYKGIFEVSREDDDRIVNQRFNTCRNNGCLTLDNGELHHCSRSPNAHKVQGFNQLPPQDYVNVRDNKNLRNDLWEFLSAPKFMTACRYCYGTDQKRKVLPAEQL